MLPIAAKIALLAFVMLAALVIVVVFIRNVRKKGFPSQESSSHFDQMWGAMPPTPRPDEVEGVDGFDDGCPRGR